MKQKYFLYFLFVLIFKVGLAQSKIERAEKDLKTPEHRGRYSTKYKTTENHSSETSFLEATVERFFINLFAYTAYGVLIEPPFEHNSIHSNATLTKQVYFNSKTGHYDYE